MLHDEWGTLSQNPLSVHRRIKHHHHHHQQFKIIPWDSRLRILCLNELEMWRCLRVKRSTLWMQQSLDSVYAICPESGRLLFKTIICPLLFWMLPRCVAVWDSVHPIDCFIFFDFDVSEYFTHTHTLRDCSYNRHKCPLFLHSYSCPNWTTPTCQHSTQRTHWNTTLSLLCCMTSFPLVKKFVYHNLIDLVCLCLCWFRIRRWIRRIWVQIRWVRVRFNEEFVRFYLVVDFNLNKRLKTSWLYLKRLLKQIFQINSIIQISISSTSQRKMISDQLIMHFH